MTTFTPMPTTEAELVPLENERPINLLSWLDNYERIYQQMYEVYYARSGRWKSIEDMTAYENQMEFVRKQTHAVQDHIIMRMNAWTPPT